MSGGTTKIKPVRLLRTAANRLNLDYAGAGQLMPAPSASIIDVHSHIGGGEAARIYADVARVYGIGLTYSMTHLDEIDRVRDVLGDRIRFIAIPDYRAEDKRHHLGVGFIPRIEQFHAKGARIVKFWSAPRGLDYGRELGDASFMRIDAPHRIDAMEAARALGMIFMTHIADPNTWFHAKYTDASFYGTKAEQYEPLETLLERFDQPWIAAHFGGWPEDLEFVDGLLSRHDNLYIDTSATKWMVRELSRHSRSDLVAFFEKFAGRVLFGSDIVTLDEHLSKVETDDPATADTTRAATSPEQAYDLYASRYWALRTLFETRYVGESPIADPDLAMVDSDRYGALDAPPLIGKHLPEPLLRSLYHDAAKVLLEPLFGDRNGSDARSLESV